MKLLLYTDNHFCQYSSILRKRGDKYSYRLENQIQSINWVQSLATELGCSSVFCLGDFFDANSLNAEELTALKDIKWANVPNNFIVGNHELGCFDGSISSAHLLNLIPNSCIINKPVLFDCRGVNLLCIPYLTDNKGLLKLIQNIPHDKRLIVFSHNDVKGIQYGAYTSTEGFDIEEIRTGCALFINGHLHNYSRFCANGYNLGNLTGQNFSEDANLYSHNVMVLDTDTLSINLIENPYALNFYKLDMTEMPLSEIPNRLQALKNNAVITVKVKDSQLLPIKEMISAASNILESRLLLQPDVTAVTESIEELVTVDHREQFKQYVIEKLGSSEVVIAELAKICEG